MVTTDDRNLASESEGSFRNLAITTISSEDEISLGSPHTFYFELNATSVTTETAFDSNDASSKTYHCLSSIGIIENPISQSNSDWVYTSHIVGSNGSSGDSSTDIGGQSSGAQMAEIFTVVLAGVMTYLI